MDYVTSYSQTHIRAPVEYEILPYLLSKCKCTYISECDLISIYFTCLYMAIMEQDMNQRRYCLYVLPYTYEHTYISHTIFYNTF